MAWIPPIVRQWKTIALSWSRLRCSIQSRVNKRISLWDNHTSGNTCKKYLFYVCNLFFLQFLDCNLAPYCCLDNQLPKRTIVDNIVKNYVSEWRQLYAELKVCQAEAEIN